MLASPILHDVPQTDAAPTSAADDLLAACFEQAASLLLVLGPDGVVREANASARRFAGGASLVGTVAWEGPLAAGSLAGGALVHAAVARAANGQRGVAEVTRHPAFGAATTVELTFVSLRNGAGVLVEGREVPPARRSDTPQRAPTRTRAD